MSFRDLGMKLSLPFNFSPDYTREILERYAEDTEEVYLPFYWTVAPTGRSGADFTSYRDYLRAVDALDEAARAKGIRLDFVANLEPSPRQGRAIVDEAERLFERYPGARFTVACIDVAADVHRALPEAEIIPSILSKVSTPLQARYWRDEVGSTTLAIPPFINRRPAILARFQEMGFRIKALALDYCIPDCPVEYRHRQLMPMADELCEGAVIDEYRPIIAASGVHCRAMARRIMASPDTALLVAQMCLLPGHLANLRGLVQVIKVKGRSAGDAFIRRHVDYLLEATALRPLDAPVDWEEPPEAWDRLATCERDCEACGWCQANMKLLRVGTTVGDGFMRGEVQARLEALSERSESGLPPAPTLQAATSASEAVAGAPPEAEPPAPTTPPGPPATLWLARMETALARIASEHPAAMRGYIATGLSLQSEAGAWQLAVTLEGAAPLRIELGENEGLPEAFLRHRRVALRHDRRAVDLDEHAGAVMSLLLRLFARVVDEVSDSLA